MTFVHGKSARVYMGGYDLSGYLNEASVAAERELIDATVFTDETARWVPGLPNATHTLAGYVDVPETEVDGWDLLLKTALASDDSGVWAFMPQGDTAGYLARGSVVREKSYEIATPADGVASIKVEGQVIGAVENLTILAAKASRNADGTSSNLNLGSGPVLLGGAAHLHVFSLTGTTPTLDVIVEGSANGSTGWATLATFTQVTDATAPMAERQAIAVGVSIPRYIRASWDLSVGATGVFWVGFQRF